MNGCVHGLANVQKGNDSYYHSYTGAFHRRMGEQESYGKLSKTREEWLKMRHNSINNEKSCNVIKQLLAATYVHVHFP